VVGWFGSPNHPTTQPSNHLITCNGQRTRRNFLARKSYYTGETCEGEHAHITVCRGIELWQKRFVARAAAASVPPRHSFVSNAAHRWRLRRPGRPRAWRGSHAQAAARTTPKTLASASCAGAASASRRRRSRNPRRIAPRRLHTPNPHARQRGRATHGSTRARQCYHRDQPRRRFVTPGHTTPRLAQ
jgi:hypothetical protein